MPNQYKPDLVGAPNSMSPHLRFGCLSIRRFYWEIHDLFAKVHTACSNGLLFSTQTVFPVRVDREHDCTQSVDAQIL